MLPQSTERIVEVQGTPEGLQRAVWEICKCLVDDWQRGTGTVLYSPIARAQPSGSGGLGTSTGGSTYNSSGAGRNDYSSPRVMRTGNGADFSNGGSRTFNRRSDSDAGLRGPPTHDENGEEIQTQNISIPADMVGCIIGRAGSKISEIRKTSGARISIAKVMVNRPFQCVRGSNSCLYRLHTTRRASVCLPLWVPSKPTSRLFFCSMRILKRKRCDAAKPRILNKVHFTASRWP